MRVVLLTALLAIPASAATIPARDMPTYNSTPRDAAGLCPKTAAQMAADQVRKGGGRDLFHNLTDLPPAADYVAVYRTVDGCEAPIVVKYGLGGR